MRSFTTPLFVRCLMVSLPALATVSLNARPEPQTLAIGRMATAPVIDGQLTDWPADASVFLLGEAEQTLPRAANWAGARDLSGAVRLAWDDTYLYLAADVADDKPLQASATGAEPWHGDSMEIFFNASPGEQRKAGFYQVGLVPPIAAGVKLAVLCPQGDFPGVEGAAVGRTNGYTFECRIPWKTIAGVSPAAGGKVGFQIMLNDRDSKGRKSQLCWYPSAITYAHPLDMNVLQLAGTGAGQVGPALLAGSNAAIVTNPKQAGLSVITRLPGATSVRISTAGAEPVTWPLEKSGSELAVAAGNFPLAGKNDGAAVFTTAVLGADGAVLAERAVPVELAGTRYTAMRDQLKVLQARLKSPAVTAKADAETLAGLGFWVQRVAALASNEARPESVRAEMLEQILVEEADIARALDGVERGENPYAAGRTGSYVRAYRSPLTGEFRPHSLFVPAGIATGEKRPLIVVLHGIFGDDRHLFQMLDSVKGLGAIVYQAASYRQFDWADISAAETWAGLDQVLASQPVDRERVYLIGHHNGGRGVLQLAMARPGFFAALAPLYPGIDTKPAYPALQLYPQFYDQAAPGNLIPFPVYKVEPAPAPVTDPLERKLMERLSLATRAENIAGVPIRMVVGEAQPDATAERLALLGRLKALGDNVPVRHDVGAQHGAKPAELDDPAFYQWLLAQRRSAGAADKGFDFVVADLRDNTAGFVRVDALTSPVEPGRLHAVYAEGKYVVTTKGVAGISSLVEHGTTGTFVVDGQACDHGALVKNAGGKWVPGGVPAGVKRSGWSGPIDDFQRDRFIYVYGADTEKAARKLANRGLGTEFSVKADRELTDDDRVHAHLVLVGTPANNAELAKLADRLPLKWEADGGLRLGDATTSGAGAAACVIYPNPSVEGRYVVVITAADDAGYKVWAERAGVDYVLTRASAAEKGGLEVVARGVFDNAWTFSPEFRVKAKAP